MEYDINEKLIESLNLISEYYKYADDKNREAAYANVANKLLSVDVIINSGEEAKRILISGVGPSISHDIDEFVSSGKISRLEKLKTENPIRSTTVENFMKVYGIGAKLANNFYDMGYRNYNDLWNDANLTDSQKLGLIYLKQFNMKIPRIEMDIIHNKIDKILKPLNIYYEIVGSYRRNESESSDIDILIRNDNVLGLSSVVSYLREYLIHDLALGNSKYLGIWKMDGFNAHRIDILLINKESWYTSLLYFTGSKKFNILIRSVAKEKGLKLNEYGLYTQDNKVYKINSEKDIFDILGLKYLVPEERVSYLNYLENI